MALTYAGVPLPLLTAEASSWIGLNVPPFERADFERPRWPGPRLSNLTYRTPEDPGMRRVGSLWWPRDASRWAVGYFVATSDKLAQIQQQVIPPGNYRTGKLVLSQQRADGSVASLVEADLWMLPARPLSDLGPGLNGLWLLTLVDDRYFWQYKSTGVLTVTEGTTSWASLYSSLGTALGVTVSAEAVHSEYLRPSKYLTARYDQSPLLLDAVAYNVGQRVVRQLAGTVEALTPTTARTRQQQQLATARTKRAGGKLRFEPATAGNHLPAAVPASVTLAFPRTVSGALQSDPYAITKNLSALGVVEAGSVGHAGSKTFHETAVATGAGTPTNDTALQALTTRFAQDWYRWAVASLDQVYNGVLPWTFTGLEDAVEWTYRGDELTTRIHRAPWNDRTEELLHLDSAANSQSSTLPGGSSSVSFPSTGSVSTPPASLLTIPTLTVTGAPTFTAPAGTLVFNTVSNTLYLYTGTAWVEVSLGSIGSGGGGGGSLKDWHYWKNVGTSGGAGTCWYGSSSMNNSDATSQTFTGATMFAAPFLTPKSITVDRIAIRVLTANAGSNARLGIYSAASDTDLYPSARLIDAGEIDAGTTGWKELTISQALAAGTLYFLTVLIEDSSAAYMAMRTEDIVPVFGFPNQPTTTDPKRAAVSAAQAYGALPATFPAGGSLLEAASTTFFPLVFVRLSA